MNNYMCNISKEENFIDTFPATFIKKGIHLGYALILSAILLVALMPIPWTIGGGAKGNIVLSAMLWNILIMLIVMAIPAITGGIVAEILWNKSKRSWIAMAMATLIWIIFFLIIFTLFGTLIILTSSYYLRFPSYIVYLLVLLALVWYMRQFVLLCKYKRRTNPNRLIENEENF